MKRASSEARKSAALATSHAVQVVAEAMGLQPRVGGVWDLGGASNISMISLAAAAIEVGQCEIALISGADNPRTGTTQANEWPWVNAAP